MFPMQQQQKRKGDREREVRMVVAEIGVAAWRWIAGGQSRLQLHETREVLRRRGSSSSSSSSISGSNKKEEKKEPTQHIFKHTLNTAQLLVQSHARFRNEGHDFFPNIVSF